MNSLRSGEQVTLESSRDKLLGPRALASLLDAMSSLGLEWHVPASRPVLGPALSRGKAGSGLMDHGQGTRQ